MDESFKPHTLLSHGYNYHSSYRWKRDGDLSYMYIFQVLRSYIWPVATIMDSTALDGLLKFSLFSSIIQDINYYQDNYPNSTFIASFLYLVISSRLLMKWLYHSQNPSIQHSLTKDVFVFPEWKCVIVLCFHKALDPLVKLMCTSHLYPSHVLSLSLLTHLLLFSTAGYPHWRLW